MEEEDAVQPISDRPKLPEFYGAPADWDTMLPWS